MLIYDEISTFSLLSSWHGLGYGTALVWNNPAVFSKALGLAHLFAKSFVKTNAYNHRAL